ncbi:MAG: sugar transferase [Ignavibacteria bacterium]|nr:sugar transferase [Ignavibacteria bacterium]
MRRLFDFTVAFIGLLVLSPLLLIIGIAIKLHDMGPIFYHTQRVGLNGQLFGLYKFRTMVREADVDAPGLTAAEDRRITALGLFLRRYKLDELPQLINVLRGEMSLVGPRPEDPRFVAVYTVDQRKVLTFQPGITSPASIFFKREEMLLTEDDWVQKYSERILPRKLAIDIEYFRNRSMWGDVRVVLRTISGIIN